MVMDIDVALYFLGGSIFIGLGVCIIGVFVLLMNNIYHKFWKPIEWIIPQYRFIDATAEPKPVDKTNEPKL